MADDLVQSISRSRPTSAAGSVTGGAQLGPVHTNPRAVPPAGVLPSRIDGEAHGPAMHRVGA